MGKNSSQIADTKAFFKIMKNIKPLPKTDTKEELKALMQQQNKDFEAKKAAEDNLIEAYNNKKLKSEKLINKAKNLIKARANQDTNT